MNVWSSLILGARVWTNRVKVANPARGELNMEKSHSALTVDIPSFFLWFVIDSRTIACRVDGWYVCIY